MANIQEKIYSKYAIDIAQENILKLYKIDKPDITDQQVQEAITATRKRWNQSINGANEKNAERDKARLEKADKYEAILRDSTLRKELYRFYNSSSDTGSSNGSGTGVKFAREYFELISTTKKIKKKDVEFFFKYYQEERKNKKAILEMLEDEFKIIGLGKESSYADEDAKEEEGKKKNNSSPLIVNLFQEATIIKLKKCFGFYEAAKANSEICQRFPKIKDGLYDFLELKSVDNIQNFSAIISEKAKESYAIRQEKGSEYIPLVDLFNTLQSMAEYQDIVDNFGEFKLLVRYPKLTPYMFAFVDMKPATLRGLYEVANSEYVFRDESDFLTSYFLEIYDNFGISESGISSIIKKAEKKAKANKVLDKIDEKLGRDKKRKLSIGAKIIHWLVYYPIFAVYFVFEVFKAIFIHLDKLTIPIFVALFVGENWLFPKVLGMDNLLVLGKIFNKTKWYGYLTDFIGEPMRNGFEAFTVSLLYIGLLLVAYVILPLMAAKFVNSFADNLNKRYDWIGYERTFQNIFGYIREKTEKQYLNNKKLFYKDKVKKIIVNLICTAIITVLICLAPTGFAKLNEATGLFQKDSKQEEKQVQEIVIPKDEPKVPEVVGYVEITVSSANVRSGPSTDYGVITVVYQGTVLEMTGNQQVAANGGIWYEVYLNAEKTEIAWVSEQVLKIQE